MKSELDALNIKEIEKLFLEKILINEKYIQKVTPFCGINSDILYIKDDKLLFIKFMDTSEELFFLLEEELLEVMHDEYILFEEKMNENFKNISYEYIFVMPNVDIEENYEFDEFIYGNILDKKGVSEALKNKNYLDKYLKKQNNEIEMMLFILNICPEYFVLNSDLHLNKDFKKISFYNNDFEYSAVMLEKEQIDIVNSINYNETIYEGGYGTGKTTIMLSKAIKLSRIYPHHKFLILTNSRQKALEIRENLDILYNDCQNIKVYTLDSFVIKLCKKLDLVVDYNLLNNDYDKGFKILKKQIDNNLKNKKMFKGIFVDNIENFKDEDLIFIKEFLYQSKYIFNGFYNKCGIIYNDFNIFRKYRELNTIKVDKNYRNSNEVLEFINKLNENNNKYLKTLRNKEDDFFYKTELVKKNNSGVNLIKVNDTEEKMESIIWEINYLVNNKGLKLSDICIVYPYNKKKLKNNKVIYVQYLLKKVLEKNNIRYILIEDSLTNLSVKNGVTISNMYSLGDLEYKALIVCEIEMLYNQHIIDSSQDYQVNDFFGDLNKLYLMFSKATSYLSIITSLDDKNSEIINIIKKSL